MIRLGDATLLALTKLKTHKLRTITMVGVSGLLFAVLVTASIVARGAFNSIEIFSHEGYGDRYIVLAVRDISDPGATQDKSVWKRANTLYAETISAKKEAAKMIGVTYDEKTEITPLRTDDGKIENSYLDLRSPAAQQALSEHKAQKASYSMLDLKRIAKDYNPIDFFTSDMKTPANGTIVTMKNDSEDFSLNQTEASVYTNTDPLAQGFSVADPSLINPFILKSKNTIQPKSNVVPLIISYKAAEKYLHLPPLTNTASLEDKVNRIKYLQSKALSIQFDACYRNNVSLQRIQDAISVANEIKANETNKAYVKPRLIYGLPSKTSCGAPIILSDTRAETEKLLTVKQNQFDVQFGVEVEPDQQKVSFQVIGLAPESNHLSDSVSTAADLLRSLAGSTLNGAAVTPADAYQNLRNNKRLDQIFTPTATSSFSFPSDTLFAEFKTASDARSFITDKGCTTRSDGNCSTTDRPFQLIAFGSNSIALDDLKTKFTQLFIYGVSLAIVIAATISGSASARMIIEGRRETAVFRSLGFKRIDIALIYSIYTFFISLLIAAFSLLLGVIMAYGIDRYLWYDTTLQAQLAFSVLDFTKEFHFFSVDVQEIATIVSMIIVAGFAGMALPLIRNVKRNPINDMRDE